MTDRERLIELLMQGELEAEKQGVFNCSRSEWKAEIIADFLLENGVTFNRRWISVAEQLPNTDGRFEVTIKGSKGKRYIAVCNYNKNANFNKWGNVNVIAWRERYKPYYGDREMN